MARQWFIPSGVMPLSGVMIDEDGAEEYFIPALGMFNEDQAAAAVGNDPDTDAALFITGQQQPVIEVPTAVAY